MMFLDGPSQFAKIEHWEAWAERLKTLNPHDRTVVDEKKRTARIIEHLRNPSKVKHDPIPE